MMMLDDKLYLTSVVEFLRRGRVDCGTIEGKVVVVVVSSKQKVNPYGNASISMSAWYILSMQWSSRGCTFYVTSRSLQGPVSKHT